MNSFLLFLTGVFSGIFAGFFLTKSFWKTNREASLFVFQKDLVKKKPANIPENTPVKKSKKLFILA